MITGSSTGSAFNTAVGGMLNSSANMNADAVAVVRAGTTAGSGDYIGDVTQAMVDMKIQQNTFAASAKVIKSADDMLGSLLDIMG